MCRMFGMAAEAPTSPRQLLCDAPGSLRTLSVEHCDGWGVAIHDAGDWLIERSTSCAAASERYAEVARTETRLLIAHIRKKTVGPSSLANTHPFHRDGMVFAHNGTLPDVSALTARTAPEQLARIEGDTDSERLFAFLLTQIAAARDVAHGVATAVRTLRSLGDLGPATFLLSCGTQLYAHRAGRSLFTLARDGAMMVASEPLTDERWLEVPDQSLVVLDTMSVHAIAA
ncbi:MAG: Glutamine amidotransferase, class-II [Myxococcales bacterium]|nr:Glutamine amidotransferase, class-II [Myxococcales bacterium]